MSTAASWAVMSSLRCGRKGPHGKNSIVDMARERAPQGKLDFLEFLEGFEPIPFSH